MDKEKRLRYPVEQTFQIWIFVATLCEDIW